MESKFTLKKLNIRQTILAYNASLRQEFPVNERRPLALIIKGMLAGTYECLGAFYKGHMVGYAFFLKQGDDYLWDYLAVLKKYRCKGVGTRIIKGVREYYKSAASVIGEVEDPAYAKTKEEQERMTRRLQFYLRNGCVDTRVFARTFGAQFILIRISEAPLDMARVEELYHMHYRVSLPKRLYQGNIKTYR